jgi:hypothetical protein
VDLQNSIEPQKESFKTGKRNNKHLSLQRILRTEVKLILSIIENN